MHQIIPQSKSILNHIVHHFEAQKLFLIIWHSLKKLGALELHKIQAYLSVHWMGNLEIIHFLTAFYSLSKIT